MEIVEKLQTENLTGLVNECDREREFLGVFTPGSIREALSDTRRRSPFGSARLHTSEHNNRTEIAEKKQSQLGSIQSWSGPFR